MSRDREYRITCDGPADDPWCDKGPEGYSATTFMCETRKEAEVVARSEGWKIGKRDVCPDCQPGAGRDDEEADR